MLLNTKFMSEKLNNFKKALEEKGLLVAIKTAFNEHVANAPAPSPEPTPIALAEVELKSGSKISYEGDKLDIGVAVKMVNADGSNSELIDGEYELADGSKFYVKGGLVEKMAAATPIVDPNPAPEMDMAARVAALETELKAMKDDKSKANETMLSRLEAIEKLSKSTHEGLKTSLSAIDAIIETPAAEPIVNQKSWADMTPVERFRALKNK
jgi:hypothetical protein